MALRRIQVLVDECQDDELEQLARLRGTSKSELVREALALLLDFKVPDDDPFYLMIGKSASGLGDLSQRHDDYIAEAEFAKWQPPT